MKKALNIFFKVHLVTDGFTLALKVSVLVLQPRRSPVSLWPHSLVFIRPWSEFSVPPPLSLSLPCPPSVNLDAV